MLPTAMKSLPGPHTARNGDIQRPVLLLWEMMVASCNAVSPRQMRTVLSLDVLRTRRDPSNGMHMTLHERHVSIRTPGA